MGCANTIENLRDTDLAQGCVVIEAQAKLGYFNQEGAAEVCKLKCSDILPDGLKYEYANPRSGCKVTVGVPSSE